MSTRQSSVEFYDWEKFCERRGHDLTALAERVEESFLRRDTRHPVFCGCIDWHSSVHGAYALLTAARLAGQSRWADTVDAALSPECLHAELASLRNGELNHELPYGFSWFLKLAKERVHGWGKSDLRPLAMEIASRVEQWILSLSDEAVTRHAQRREYGNLSWALLNLWEWSEWEGNLELVKTLRQFTRRRIVPLDEILPLSYDHIANEFFAASLQRTRAILSILPQEESLPWFASFFPKGISMEPIRTAPTPHSAGLNFSRAWAFWTLFQSTQDLAFRDLYVRHIVTQMNRPECWRDDYQKHAHWVPQFGIYALSLSMGGELA
ncbi:MAG: DUF2891 family protein [Nitrospirales bacterium]